MAFGERKVHIYDAPTVRAVLVGERRMFCEDMVNSNSDTLRSNAGCVFPTYTVTGEG